MTKDRDMPRMTASALALLDRNRRALRLRAQGMPWPEIARECGFTTAHSALVAVQRLVRRETREDVETSRAIYRERLEMLMRSLWLPAVNPGLALQAAREAGAPAPPSQEHAIELVRRLLDDLSAIEGTKVPRPLAVAGPDGGPVVIAGRADVVQWVPDDAFMRRYAAVLLEAGLLDLPINVTPR